jgi:DNA-directed RNA polymerase specialized sigma24 family protein
MRDILVEQARRKAGPKRGGGQRRRELDEACAVLEPPSDDVLAVHEALEELEARDRLKAQIVLLRYFTGLTMDETAAILGLAERTLDRHWRYLEARQHLGRCIGPAQGARLWRCPRHRRRPADDLEPNPD